MKGEDWEGGGRKGKGKGRKRGVGNMRTRLIGSDLSQPDSRVKESKTFNNV